VKDLDLVDGKLSKDEEGDRAAVYDDFRRECIIMSRLNHPNIVRQSTVYMHTHAHAYYIHTHIYIFLCVFVYVCTCAVMTHHLFYLSIWCDVKTDVRS